MKKLFLSMLLAAICAVNADEIAVEPPMKTMLQEFSDGTMTGKNSHSAVVGGKKYADCWEYYTIESGLTPETFKYLPLKAISPDAAAAQAWKKYFPILALDISPDGKKLTYPMLMRGNFEIRYTNKTFGNAFALKNPFNSEVICYVEGKLRHTEEAAVFVYLVKADGTAKLLLDDKNPDGVFNKIEKHKNGHVEKRHYLKLQLEFKMQSGDKLFFAAVRPDFAGKKTGKPSVGTLCVDDRWGKASNPIISFEK